MSYVLTPIQQAAFVDRFDIWKPSRIAEGADKRMQGETYTLSVANCPCRQTAKSEASKPGATGRANVDQMDTTDVLRVHNDEELGDRYYVQNTTVGHPEYLTWYIIQGGAQVRNFKAKTKTFLMVRGLKPPGYT